MKEADFGSWPSPIGAQALAAADIRLGMIALDGEDIYWVEGRPSEAGRSVIVRRDSSGAHSDITPAPFNVRSTVHEYGGGAFTVHAGQVYFVNFADQDIYRQIGAAAPERITRNGNSRYADLCPDPERQRLICVRETERSGGEPENSLVAVGLGGAGAVDVLASGADFYASACLSPNGRQLAWLCWHHPNMPWDQTELHCAALDGNGRPTDGQCIAGGAGESIFQPQWGPGGFLYFVSDRSGWWNLYRWQDGAAKPLLPMEAEFGLPQWVFGMSTYAFDDAGDILFGYCQRGEWRLGRWSQQGAGAVQPLATPFSDISGLRCNGKRLCFHAGSPQSATAIVQLDLASSALTTVQSASSLEIESGYLSAAEVIQFPTSGGEHAHAFFYPPTNPGFRGRVNESPPLLVKGHGGPTSATSSTLNAGIQYWTSRGFAVVDVNYRGSTGYGRDYRRQLDGRWGIADVDDCVAAARFLIDRGSVDGERCAIRGNSAGGYTTLAALTFQPLFRAGASYYGIGDLSVLASDTHKFESRYMDRLVGPYPAASAIYRDRSPLHHVDRLAAPIIFFQGLQDKVVPPNQAEAMVRALADKGIPVAYVTFADESHGFRQAENIQRSLEAELYFYGRVFGFDPADKLSPVVIENMPAE